MRRHRLGALGLGALAFLGALACASALAYFTASGAGTASAGVSQLPPPAIETATGGTGGSVTLGWNSVAAPGPGTVSYSVVRDGGNAGGTCAGELAATGCVDSGLSAGSHEYVVTATWRSWSSPGEPKSVFVPSAAPDHFVLTAASTSPVAGAADNLTIVAQDAAGGAAVGYSGSHSLTFSGAEASPGGKKPTVADSSGKAVDFGSPTSLDFTSGVASVSMAKNGAMRLYASGPAAIEVSDGSIGTKEPLGVDVGAAEVSKLALSAATASPVAGAADALTTIAQDAYGNVTPGYAGQRTLTFSGASAGPGGDVPTVSDANGQAIPFGTGTTIGFVAGIASVAGGSNGVMRLYKSGAATVQVSVGSLSATLPTTTAAAEGAQLQIAAASTAPGAGVSNDLTIVAEDAYANIATSYSGARSLTFTGAAPSPSGAGPTVVDSAGTAIPFGTPTTLDFSSGVASVTASSNGAMTLYRAGDASVAATDGAISTPAPPTLAVAPGEAARLGLIEVEYSAGTLEPGCIFACTLSGLGNRGKVSARAAVTDDYGNTVDSIGKGHKAKAKTDGSGTISGSKLSFPRKGPAESKKPFTFKAKASGGFVETITVAVKKGTAYTSATMAVSK